jgi:hypothetical protein
MRSATAAASPASRETRRFEQKVADAQEALVHVQADIAAVDQQIDLLADTTSTPPDRPHEAGRDLLP